MGDAQDKVRVLLHTRSNGLATVAGAEKVLREMAGESTAPLRVNTRADGHLTLHMAFCHHAGDDEPTVEQVRSCLVLPGEDRPCSKCQPFEAWGLVEG